MKISATVVGGVCAMGLCAQPQAACAQDAFAPAQIRLVLGFPPGATTDAVARLLAQKLAAQMNTSVFADNKPGADANIAAEFVAKARPDGQTLLFNTPSIVLSMAYGHKLSYDALRDFAPVALVASSPYVLVAHPAVPANTATEFVAYLKANPDKLAFGSAGSLSYLAPLLFLQANGLKALHVPYKGGGPVLVDLVAGRVQFAMTGQTPVMPMVKDRRIKALAFAALRRSALLPDVPTLHESLMPDFEIGAWFGVLTPAQTPATAVQRLNTEIARAVQDPDMKSRLAQEGAEPLIATPEQYGAYFKSELIRWSRLVRSAGLKAE